MHHFPARHEYDVEAAARCVTPEELTGQAFGPISNDRRANLSGRCDTEPRGELPVRHRDQRHESSMRA
jgi:hypothetical protein